jgi:hypothetical protein
MSDKAITVAAKRVRALEAELNDARVALEAEILNAGWTELTRHTSTNGQSSITYIHTGREPSVDRFTGQRVTGAEARSFADFVAGEIS